MSGKERTVKFPFYELTGGTNDFKTKDFPVHSFSEANFFQ